ncbi:hypothetical protein [Thermosynechococcus sp. M98_K2018_005]|uniref:hypothetical protein n=1 Tax=Thermosynechococcus sp. M98_K2018_005 TaxID=2747811 RepID=UPI0025E7B0D5|nr:hypothetical protein [Thermosynechococcus sp. M98_K2018_005]
MRPAISPTRAFVPRRDISINGKKDIRSRVLRVGQIEENSENIKELLNSQEDFLSAVTVNSPRAVGDAVQDILAHHLQAVVWVFALYNHCTASLPFAYN